MNAPDALFLPDVQSAPDGRKLAIQRVGIRGLRLPLTIATAQGAQATVAEVAMSVALRAEQKGTHMSRFIELLHAAREPLGAAALRGLLTAMLDRLDADAGRIDLRFPYFVTKAAPVSGVASLMDYEVRWTAETAADGAVALTLAVAVPVTSLCPCSKQVADYGAHNQRSCITIALRHDGDIGLDEPVRLAEQSASSELWALLKRSDEKYVTERAYDNPKFVEDIVRDVALALDRDARVHAYRVEVENFESIHNHSAWAVIERDKRAPAALGVVPPLA